MSRPPTPDHVEWPTVAVAVAIFAGFAAVIGWHQHLPAGLTVVVLAVLSGWYGSLQHEVIHGHPTPWHRVNDALGALPLGLAIRFGDYRRSHLAHHATAELTDPVADPESFYVAPHRWERAGPVVRAWYRVQFTLAGRLLLGPLAAVSGAVRRGLAAARTRNGAAVLTVHVVGVVAVLALVHLAGVPLWVYVLGACWGGTSVSMLRSFVEHRAVASGTRSAVVHTNRLGSLLFLNNNLHHTHHARPGVPWYGLPAVHAATRGDDAAAAGAGTYFGYGHVAWRFLLRPLDHPVAGRRSDSTAGPEPMLNGVVDTGLHSAVEPA